MDQREIEEFGRQLRERVPSISPEDLRRILTVATDNTGQSLSSIADGLGVSLDGLNYTLRKLYRNPAVPRINDLEELRTWERGEIADPFGDSITIVDEIGDLRPTDVVVFFYGSCMNPTSLARTTGQDPHEIEYVPAQLVNHVAEWDAPSHRLNYCSTDWQSLDDVCWLWLSILRTGNPADVVNGALVKLRGPQYQLVRAREAHYQEINVIDDVRVVGPTSLAAPYRRIITFAPDASRIDHDRKGKRLAVRAGYYEGSEKYLRRLHPGLDARLPKLPEGVKLVEGYPTDDRIADEYWKPNQKASLDRHYSLLDKDLYQNNVTRQTSDGFGTIPFGSKPITLNRHTFDQVVKVAESTVSILAKSHQLVLQDRRLFDLNGYTEVDRMLSNPQLANNFAELPNLARVDLALHGDKLIVFELNSGSPAGMFHLDELKNRLWQQLLSGELTGDLVSVLEPPDELGVCDTIAESFMKGWQRFIERRPTPGPEQMPRRIAIVDRDIDKVAAYTEFETFRKLFLQRIYGITEGPDNQNTADEVLILDIKDLRYREDHRELTDRSGRPIDAVYKRLLWQEAIEIGMGGLDDPLCKAYLDDAVFVMNSYPSSLTGSKLNMAIAKSPSFEARCNDTGLELSDDERDILESNLPETLLWGPESLDDRTPEELKSHVMNDITGWVLKGYHGKGGQEFIDGAPANDVPPVNQFLAAWDAGNCIAQRHQDHGMVDMPVYDSRQRGTVWGRYPFILGAYVVDGKCVGIEAKFADGIPINVNRSAKRTVVFSLKR